MDRRTFLKTTGLGSIAFAYGCNQNPDKNLFTLVHAPEDMITGKPAWYASTCMECPAGCGILAKNREGRVIKIEGNPNHPINKGKLCIRGQAGLQAIYDPDRISSPKLKIDGKFKDIKLDQALQILSRKTQEATAQGDNQVKMLCGLIGQALNHLLTDTLSEWKAKPPLLFEPFAYDSIKTAYQTLFSMKAIPSLHMEKADFILSLGADFLETWISPVEYAQKFKLMHGTNKGKKGVFIHIGPYMSLTAANADKFLSIKAGTEPLVVLGLIKQLLESNQGKSLPTDYINELKELVAGFSPGFIEKSTALPVNYQKLIAKKLTESEFPLVLGGSLPTPNSTALEIAVGLLNFMLDKRMSLFDFDKRHRIEQTSPLNDVNRFFKDIRTDKTKLLMFYQTNPLHVFPNNTELQQVLKQKDTFKISFSSFFDETSSKCDLIFPVRLPLETWDTYESKSSICSTMQPAMGKLTQAPPIGDLFVPLSNRYRRFSDYHHYLMEYLYPGNDRKAIEPWFKMIQKGGQFESTEYSAKPDYSLNPKSITFLKQLLSTSLSADSTELKFLAVPSIRYFDGRGANKAWLNEIPDGITSISWETMILAHPNTLKQNGLKQGDLIQLESNGKTIQAPAYSYHGVDPGLFVMPTGQGHKAYGRYAESIGSNPFELLMSSSETDLMSFLTPISSVKKIGTVDPLPKTDGSRSQHKRKIAPSFIIGEEGHSSSHKEGLTMNQFPLTLPLPEGYDKKRDVYSAHSHDSYRWGMVIDLDRCIGCSACVGACYAENNIGIVGKTQLAKGREMSWLRIERYEDQTDPGKLVFLPMLCQHCDNAPCESVCPVYAPHHSKEGLNNQIYNRCIGTRFCAQNCPYKVRRFNWFDWQWPKPSNLQLNPNVTVRSKGVMEKCSFCVQRIKEAHGIAKNENREIRDGEIQPACVQTCPTDALVFGNFMDKNSKIRALAKDYRAYQVLGYLNTKPAVIYMKKVVRKI